MPEPTPAPAQTPGERFEAAQPEWARWLGGFCENWIYAFLIAFAIKQFCIEPFRIPSSSMEPMMLGDPGFFSFRGDLVIVDKLWWRFTGIQRFDVTVFQFPVPEVEGASDGYPAFDRDGNRNDHWLLKPPFCRNFVKRTLLMPGEEFYLRNGNLYVRDAGGAWKPLRRPPHIQDVMWQTVYRPADQRGYLPWSAFGGANVTGDGGRVEIDFAATATAGTRSGVVFTQPLINAYFKPGPHDVIRTDTGQSARGVDVAMTRPLFDQHGVSGNIWHLDQWTVKNFYSTDTRPTPERGTPINANGREAITDLRLRGRIAALTAACRLRLAFGPTFHEVELRRDGWTVQAGDAAGLRSLGSATRAMEGAAIAFTRLDDQILFSVDGSEVLRVDVPEVDATAHPPTLSCLGSGALHLLDLAIDRDQHWSRAGVLTDERNALQPADLVIATRNAELAPRVRHWFGGPDSAVAWADAPERPGKVPADCIVLLGDNSPSSWDSRNWGPVPIENLRGRAWFVLWPAWRWKVVR